MRKFTNTRKGVWLLAVALAALAFAPRDASAEPIYSFTTGINEGNSGSPYTVEVFDKGVNLSTCKNQVEFLFKVASGSGIVDIEGIYFQDGTLLTLQSSFVDPVGTVSFTAGSASPPDLPGGNSLTPKFNTHAGFLADSNSPTSSNGIGAGEQLGLVFDLQSGKTYADTLAALDAGLTPSNIWNPDGSTISGKSGIRIGIHVQNTPIGGSDSFINGPSSGVTVLETVPEPSTMALALSGLVGMGIAGVRRFRRCKNAESTVA